jgi:hypothetical protein
MTDADYIERRGAQALLATYAQLTRYAGLAHHLQQARLRSTQRRLEQAGDPDLVHSLQQRLEAQQTQGETIASALKRFQKRLPELADFAEAGLTVEDYRELGLHKAVGEEAIEAARIRGAAARGVAPEEQGGTSEQGVNDCAPDGCADPASSSAADGPAAAGEVDR